MILSKIYAPIEFEIKGGNSREFTAYGNVKNIVDHALDVAMDGCYLNSIKRAKENDDMPRLFWAHDPRQLPVGAIKSLEEDSKGLLFGGKLSNTTMGNDLYELAKDKAIKHFSIGYLVNQERWNSEKGYNELIEIDIKEISFVNFACNEESQLQDIKSRNQDALPDRRELEQILRAGAPLSRKLATAIASYYEPRSNAELIKAIKETELFK